MLQDCVLLARSLSVLWPRLAPSLWFLLEQPVRAEGTDGPDCPCLASSRTSSHPAHSPGPHVSLQGIQPLPQHHHTGARLQLPTALPCLAMGPAKPGLTPRLISWPDTQADILPQPRPAPVPREVPSAWGWGCPRAPQLPSSWLGRWDGMGCQALPAATGGSPVAPGAWP